MNGRGWQFWQWDAAKKSAASSRATLNEALPDECARWSPFLTALFDGEASEAEIRQARRHLLSCERCAQTWLGWNQTRALLLDQNVPRVPRGLVGRIRLVCGLAGQTASPDLHAQILARTSRSSKPRWHSAWPPLRPLAPVWGATALGAFVLLLARDSFSPVQPPAPLSDTSLASRPVSEPSAPVAPRQDAPPLPILPWQPDTARNLAPASAAPIQIAASDSDAARMLALAKRERQSLGSSSFRDVSPAPLPALAPLAPEVVPVSLQVAAPLETTRRVRRHIVALRHQGGRERLPALAPAPLLLASRPVVFASAPVTTPAATDLNPPSVPATAPSWNERRGRFLLAAMPLERAPLRISAPRARPVTVGQAPLADEAGLDDLDSTVQQYRATLSDD
jgi:hypothetical protein